MSSRTDVGSLDMRHARQAGGTLPATAVQKEFETLISSLTKAVAEVAVTQPTAHADLADPHAAAALR